MNGMIESHQVRHINAQCQPLRVYRHRLSGVQYLAVYESTRTYALKPIQDAPIHVDVRDLADAEVWQKLC